MPMYMLLHLFALAFAVVWPIKTRIRIFLPFFEWYGGDGSGSQKRIIIQEVPVDSSRLARDVPEKYQGSLLGRGSYSHVVRCTIREELRHKFISNQHKQYVGAGDAIDCPSSEETSSDELAVKVRMLIILGENINQKNSKSSYTLCYAFPAHCSHFCL